MKLVMIGPYPLDKNKIGGGTQAVTVYLLNGLRQIDGLDIHVISCRGEIDKESTVNADGMTIYYIPTVKRFGNISLGVVERYRIKKKIREIDPDIVHAQNFPNNGYSALQSGYPAVMTVHGISFKEANLKTGLINWIRKYPVRYIEKACLKKAFHVICISPYVKEMYGTSTQARLYSIENPIDDKYFEIKNQEVPGRILCIANISARKNILGLLNVVNLVKRKIPGIKLNLIGAVREPEYYDKLKTYIEEYDLESNVDFLGHVTEERIFEEYAKCNALVLFSLEETAPMVIAQAMAAGKPAVSTNVGGVVHLINDGETGFVVECGDLQKMAASIEQILKDDTLRSKMGEKAKKEAVKRFKGEAVARKTHEIYKNILSDAS